MVVRGGRAELRSEDEEGSFSREGGSGVGCVEDQATEKGCDIQREREGM